MQRRLAGLLTKSAPSWVEASPFGCSCPAGSVISRRFFFTPTAPALTSAPPASDAAAFTNAAFETQLERALLDVIKAKKGRAIPLGKLTGQLPDDIADEIDFSLRDFIAARPSNFHLSKGSDGIWQVKSTTTAAAAGSSFIPLAPTAPNPLTIPQPKEKGAQMPQLSANEIRDHHQAAAAARAKQLLLSQEERQKYRTILLNHIPLRPVPAAAVAVRRGVSTEEFVAMLQKDVPAEFVVIDEISPEEVYVSLSPLYVELLSAPVETVEEYYTGPRDDNQHCPCLVEDYDAYRLARFLGVNEFTPLEKLKAISEGVVTRPLHQVALTYPSLFAFETQEMRSVKFLLRSELLPPEVNQMNGATLREEIIHYDALRKSFKPSENAQRVNAIAKWRHLKRCFAMQSEPVPEIDPDVLAYHIFDLMGTDPVETGLVPFLLPAEIQAVTDARNKKFLNKYPHLFFMFENPPQFAVQRADLPRPEPIGAEMTEDELALYVAAVVEERRNAKKKSGQRKEVLGSHISKYLPEVVRKQVKREFGTLEKLFQKYEGKYFTIDREIHPTEMVLGVLV